jgi:putative SOS response-associated peptidase YedK
MCFYNSQSKRALDLAKRYGRKTDLIEIIQEIIDEQYKVAAFSHPLCPVVTSGPSLQAASWGLIPHWTKTEGDAMKIRKMTINARSETVFQLPSFRKPIFTQRCLIPSTGYFEFQHQENAKIPHFIYLKQEEIFSFGGIYDYWQNPVTNDILQTFTILTIPSNELCTRIHNGGKTPFRMPLILSKENEELWLEPSLKTADIKAFFQAFDTNRMDAYAVSKDFLKKRPDDASIIERAA